MKVVIALVKAAHACSLTNVPVSDPEREEQIQTRLEIMVERFHAFEESGQLRNPLRDSAPGMVEGVTLYLNEHLNFNVQVLQLEGCYSASSHETVYCFAIKLLDDPTQPSTWAQEVLESL